MRALSYALACTLCLLTACEPNSSQDDPAPRPTTGGDSVFAYLQQVDFSSLSRSFTQLAERDYRRRIRTAQLGADGDPIAVEERSVQVGSGGVRLLDQETTGTFDYGFLERFVGEADLEATSARLIDFVLPDDPAFLSLRSREDYSYRFVGDTLIDDEPARLIEATLHEAASTDHAIRRIRVAVADEGNEVVSLDLERADGALWYRERSRLSVGLRTDASGEWMPAYSRFETSLRIPLRGTQRFTTSSRYEVIENSQPGRRER